MASLSTRFCHAHFNPRSQNFYFKLRHGTDNVKQQPACRPPAATWYNFWTGDRIAGGQRIHTATPLERIPLFARGGSILRLGPEIEFTEQRPADPIELRVYRGADAAFDLYEDEGDNYNYENGSRAITPIRWNEATKSLTIGARSGQFPGMLQHRTFRIVWVGKDHGIGEEPVASIDQIIECADQTVSVSR